jgi:hypothetical protein
MMLEFFDRILRHQPGAWNERWGLNAGGGAGTAAAAEEPAPGHP